MMMMMIAVFSGLLKMSLRVVNPQRPSQNDQSLPLCLSVCFFRVCGLKDRFSDRKFGKAKLFRALIAENR